MTDMNKIDFHNNEMLKRHHTAVLMSMIEEGIWDAKNIAIAALSWMSDDEVRRMAEANELFPTD